MKSVIGPGPRYGKRQLPTVGYLSASSDRSDIDCVRRDHLSRVLAARRQFDGHKVSVEVEMEEDSIIERLSNWCNELSERQAVALIVTVSVAIGCAYVIATT